MMHDLFDLPRASNENDQQDNPEYKPELSQWMTPAWAAQAIVDHALPLFKDGAIVVEPSCGIGRFLDAIPNQYRSIGVELDPDLASIATKRGHEVVIGDFRTVDLPVDKADGIIGNPPFEAPVFNGFMTRAHTLLDDGGQVIMLLPAYIFQTAGTVMRWNRQWSMMQEMVPRNLFPRLRLPLTLARFTKDPKPRLSGFLLYHEATAISEMPKAYRKALNECRSVWEAVVGQAIENLGGQAPLKDIYMEIEPRRPTANQFWREKIRQTLQLKFEKQKNGNWAKAA